MDAHAMPSRVKAWAAKLLSDPAGNRALEAMSIWCLNMFYLFHHFAKL